MAGDENKVDGMNMHQKMAIDDIFIIGGAAFFLWIFTIESFGWFKLIGAVLATCYTVLRIYHAATWADDPEILDE